MRTVLLAWELGRGSGHVVTLGKIARLLLDQGLRVVAALRFPSTGSEIAKIGVEVIQAPRWPFDASPHSVPARELSSATMADILAAVGLGYASELDFMVRSWRDLFRHYSARLVVAEFAPGAAIAARGLLPLVQVGTGYSLPPSNLATLPFLHDASPPLWEEDAVTQTVDVVLRAHEGKRIERLSQIFEADATYIHSLPVFDPYRASRQQPADGPLDPVLPELRSAVTTDILCYLSRGFECPQRLVDGLAGLGRRLTLSAEPLSALQRQQMVAAGATVSDGLPPFNTIMQNFALCMHFGVGGTSAISLLAGVPQLALSLDIEKDLNGRALQELGVGRWIKLHDPRSSISSDEILRMAGDAELARRALQVALDLRQDIKPGRATRFIEQCVRLAG